MNGEVALEGLGETQECLTNVLILSADHLRGDLLEAGICKSPNVGRAHSEDMWSYDAEVGDAIPFDVQLVVIDLERPEAIERGLEIGHELNRRQNNPAILILAGSRQILAGVRTQMADVGPKWSFLTTDQIKGLDDLTRVIDSAAAGMTIVDPGFFPASMDSDPTDSVLTRPLTNRQVEVLELVSQGFNNEGIAGRLKITPRTVEYHLNEAYLSIKNCHSAEYNPRVYAARVFSECFGRADSGSRDSDLRVPQGTFRTPTRRLGLDTTSITLARDAA